MRGRILLGTREGEYGGGGEGGRVRGVLSKLLVGMCILNFETCTRPKSVIFRTLFSDQSKKLIPHFKPSLFQDLGHFEQAR